MDALATSILLWTASALGSLPLPGGATIWSTSGWNFELEHPQVELTADIAALNCTPDKFVELPTIMYGAIEAWGGGALLASFGDKTFKRSNYVFNSPALACSELPASGQLTLHYYAYAKTYAQITSWPTVDDFTPRDFFFKFQYGAGGFALILLAVFLYFATHAREERSVTLRVCLAALLLAIYEFGVISPVFGVKASMFTVHRYSDACLGLGMICFFAALAYEGLVPKLMIKIWATIYAVSVLIYMTSQTGDGLQLGTTIQFPITMVCALSYVALSCAQFVKKANALNGLSIVVASAFSISMISEMLVTISGGSIYSMFPLGISVGLIAFGIILNNKIERTYEERDYLRSNLEKEVQRKTAELRATQAELVQSAKLASLGTLSAGIAHEINNSINFVNGAIQPLERLISKLEPVSARDYDMGKKLLAAIKDGVGITVEIVKSLRNFTGLNQAKLKDVKVVDVAKSVSTILHAKLKDSYRVELDIPEDLTLYGDVVGINQILMNLMTNAMDAMAKGGTIRISARQSDEDVVIEVRDSGAGIPKDILDKIFDPFFTTKEVGKGTGLGLYIVNKEMERYGGKIVVNSIPAHGTAFELFFPKKLKAEIGAAA